MRWIALTCLLASPGAAQQVSPCDWQASAQALAEPWEENSATFSNGKVRLAALDTIEPAVGFAWLLVLSPPFSNLGDRQCRVVGVSDQMGFAGIYMDTLTSAYDPLTGLSFSVEVRQFDAATGEFARARLALTLNQSTGEITARWDTQ